MEIIKQFDDNSIIVLLTAQIGYSTINVSKRDGSVVFHNGIDKYFNCFEKSHWEPVDMFIGATGTEEEQGIQVGDNVLGRCNNIKSFELEVMKVTSIMPVSKSICCEGIWTDGSAIKILASNITKYHNKHQGPPSMLDYREMGGEKRYKLLTETEIQVYRKFLNSR